MLPHALSSDACSLMPGADRLAVTVELELEDGRVRRSSFYRSLIRSDARLDYDGVDRIFAGEDPAREPGRSRWRRHGPRQRRSPDGADGGGALKVESEEPEFSFDERGEPVGIQPREQTESHRLIENLMIAANEAVAARLADARHPVSLPRARASRAGADRAAGGAAGLARGAHAAAARADVPLAGGRAGGEDLPGGGSSHAQHRSRADRVRVAGAAIAQAGLLLAPGTSATPASAPPPTVISPRRSAAIRTSSVTARCCPRSDSPSTRRGLQSSLSSASGPPNASGRRPRSSATPTTSSAAFCSSGCCAGRATAGPSPGRSWG